jgi:hypothetical protein
VTREPDSSGFDAIVAAWRAEGNVPQWPDDPHLDELAADARTGVGTDARAEDDAGEPAVGRSDTADACGSDIDEAAGSRSDADGSADRRSDADDAAGDRSDADARRPPSGPRTNPDRSGTHTDAGPADAARTDPGSADDGRVDPGHAEPGSADDGLTNPGHPDPDHRGGAQGRGPDPHAEDAADGSGAANGERRPARAGAAADPHADEHFVPPEPPPLPRMGPPILVGLTLIGLGLVLVTFPGWVGVPQVYGLPLGLVAIAAGLGWLVLRLWPDPDDVPPPLYLDDPDDPDGGAIL